MTLRLVTDGDEEPPNAAVEILPDTSPAIPTGRPLHRAERARRAAPVWRIRDLADSQPLAVRTARAAIRIGVQIGHGHGVWVRRALDATTHAKVREQIRAAQLAGDREALAEWTDRLAAHKTARTGRLVEMPKAIVGAATLAGSAIVGVAVLAVIGGVLVTHWAGWSWGHYWHWWGGLFGLVASVIAVALVVAKWAFVPGWLLAAWRSGRVTEVPGWLATSAEDDDLDIDETTIAQALEALRVPNITAYIKQGFKLQYLTPARMDGRGTHAVLRLPAGVPAEKIARRRADLATGLHRLAKEVWPKTGAEAGILDLWIADKGALEEGAGPYPLLASGVVDVFKGVPAGKNLRGDPLLAPIMERNTITGGMPGQGKSASARTMMLGAALDPTVELRIWVPDTNFDFEAFEPRCSRYVMGAEREHIEQIRDDLRELHAEVQRRGRYLVEHEIPQVDRRTASRAGAGLHPMVCLLEEAHVAIQDKLFGKEIAQLLIDIVKLGRKRGIHLIVSTQAPTKDSMPRDVTRNCSNGVAFAVGDHVANDALLGQGAYREGHRATELIPGTDRGTSVVKGFVAESRSDILQWYFVHVDQVPAVIQRALDVIDKKGRALPGVSRPQLVAAEVDHLSDIHEAMHGEKRARTRDVLARLIQEKPHIYERWGFVDLAAALDEHDIEIKKLEGNRVIRIEDVEGALADRGTDL